MVITRFESILKELEIFFQCPLQADQNNSCLIKLEMGISIQFEMNRMGKLIVGCRVGTMPMNRYRANIIREALKSNESTFPSSGVFGFSQKSNNLILFLTIDPDRINKEFISTYFPPFIQKSKAWADAIATGKIPTVEQSSGESLQSPMNIFSSSKKTPLL